MIIFASGGIVSYVKLSSARELSGLKPVLKDENASGPDPVYWVFSEVTEKEWANVTVIASGRLGEEYPKTFGHYHGFDILETYHLVEGEGVLLMQKKHLDENGKHVENMVDEVYLISAKPGDEIVITPEWGHSWSNVGNGPLISFDDWRSGHKPTDYEVMEKLQGMSYYLVEENGQPKAVKNPNYTDLPEPKWVSAREFSELFPPSKV